MKFKNFLSRSFLSYLPGFRSRRKEKAILASIYYGGCLVVAAYNGFLEAIVCLSLPFVVCYSLDIFRDNKTSRANKLILGFSVLALVLAGSNAEFKTEGNRQASQEVGEELRQARELREAEHQGEYYYRPGLKHR